MKADKIEHIDTSKSKAYLYFQYGLSIFLYVISSIGILWLVIFQDLGFDKDLAEFVENKRGMLILFVSLFTVFIFAFTKIIMNLIGLATDREGNLLVNDVIYEKDKIGVKGELVFLNFSFAIITVDGLKKFWLPKGAMTRVPVAYFKKARNKQIIKLKRIINRK